METKLKTYLINAVYNWCSDSSLTPYILVFVNKYTKVPLQYVQDNKIVLNISSIASENLEINNEAITFSARFSGVTENIYIPLGHILAIYAKENNQGMQFDLEEQKEELKNDNTNDTDESSFLKVIKKNK